ncbi:hypothetical protein SAMN06265222_102249 [Neorhodopirellula lusitana]|uniref:Uncharacterized protein n=1 Tax=Neorhodopirellula lusitana TaxID=445327 RepID=A0ABY1PUU8_9BACT|nr:hypothetical protein [Neorhodopirellula lusitana]SMP47148.1 hypothetical protein SAMN06265222_102249 [Neorhodopirellula lusitana]
MNAQPVENSQPAETVLNESYLETRAKLLEVAAVLDRIDRSASTSGTPLPADGQQARGKLIGAVEILLQDTPNRAEKIQQLFSREYDPAWRQTLGLKE